MITSIEVHDKYQNCGEDIIFKTCDNDFKECASNSILFEEVPSLDQVQFDSLQDDLILFYCVCFNCQEFGHVTYMCPSENIFTLIKEEDKLYL